MSENKKNLYDLAKENGYTDEEFVNEVAQCYATHTSLVMTNMGSRITLEHTVEFEGHAINIQCRKIIKDTRTLN
ncbi:MAG: hypothetical protein K2Q45_11100 [Nitrosomonas sp.]|nr:hypothetical protein [Nitrosomonas sp.]